MTDEIQTNGERVPHSVHIQFRRVNIAHVMYFETRDEADKALAAILEAMAEPPFKNDRNRVLDITDDLGIRFATAIDEVAGAYARSEPPLAQRKADRRAGIVLAIQERRELLVEGFTEDELAAVMRGF